MARKFDMISGSWKDPDRKKKIIWKGKEEEILKAYKEGKSDSYICCYVIGCTSRWMYKLIEIDSEFAELIEHGKELSKCWWDDQGRNGMRTRGFNSSLYSLFMVNRFGWNNTKGEVKTDSKVTLESPVLNKLTDGLIDKLLENA